jgi:hypothetical protein
MWSTKHCCINQGSNKEQSLSFVEIRRLNDQDLNPEKIFGNFLVTNWCSTFLVLRNGGKAFGTENSYRTAIIFTTGICIYT